MKGNPVFRGDKLHSGEEKHNFNDPVLLEKKEFVEGGAIEDNIVIA